MCAYDRTEMKVTGLDARLADYCTCGFRVRYHASSDRERAVAEAGMREHLKPAH